MDLLKTIMMLLKEIVFTFFIKKVYDFKYNIAKYKLKTIVLILFLLCFSNKAYSQVIVEDIANLPHNILASIEAVEMVVNQVKEYKLAVEEFELMVKNSAAPYFYVYDQVKNFDDNVERLKERYSKFSDPNAVDEYFKKYYDMSWYRSSPCFQTGGCTDADLTRLSEQRAERIQKLTNISSNIEKSMTEWADNQKERYARLKKLDQEAKKAEGHFQIQSYQAQYLSEMTKELMELNESMRSFQNYIASFNEEKLEKDNIKYVINKSYQDWQPPKIKKWNRNFLD